MKTNSFYVLVLWCSSHQFLGKENIHEFGYGILWIWAEFLFTTLNVFDDRIGCQVMEHRADIDDSCLGTIFEHIEQWVGKIEWPKMIDGQGHFDIILISWQIIQYQSCIVDEDINVREWFFHFSDKLFYRLSFRKVQWKRFDEMVMFLFGVFLLVLNLSDCLLIFGLISAPKNNIISSQIQFFHGLESNSTVSTSNDNVKCLWRHFSVNLG